MASPFLPRSETSIRPATSADLLQICRLALLLGRQHETYNQARFRLRVHREGGSIQARYRAYFAEQFSRKDVVLQVAVGESRVVGYVFGRLEPASFLDLRPSGGWIHDLFLEPAWRGSGLGRQLMESALEALGDLGATTQFLSAAPQNGSARRLFEALGFRATLLEHIREATP